MRLESLVVFLFYAVINAEENRENVFNEELVIKELSDGFISSYFQFTTRSYIQKADDRKIVKQLDNERFTFDF